MEFTSYKIFLHFIIYDWLMYKLLSFQKKKYCILNTWKSGWCAQTLRLLLWSFWVFQPKAKQTEGSFVFSIQMKTWNAHFFSTVLAHHGRTIVDIPSLDDESISFICLHCTVLMEYMHIFVVIQLQKLSQKLVSTHVCIFAEFIIKMKQK